MTKAGPRAKECQKRMVLAGVDEPLREVGFDRVRKRLAWVRDTGQLLHIVNVWTRWGKYYMIQWGIRREPVTVILWGPQRDPYDVAYSAITGSGRGDGGSWGIDDETTDEAAAAMAAATAVTLRGVATFLGGFQTRQDCLAWLMANDDHRQATIPWSGPLRLFTAACFAAADRDILACAIADEVREAFSRYGRESRERIGRLMEWIEPLCREAAAFTREP